MKYAAILGLMSALLLAVGMTYPGAAWLWWWTAGSFALVAAGYANAKLGPKIFGKQGDGRIAWHNKLLLLPYLLFTWGVWHLYRVLDRRPAVNRIDEDLIVGRRLLPHEVPGGIDHYVDLTSEFEEPMAMRKLPSYISLPILDAETPALEALRAACKHVAAGRVYVHCAQGHGRTGMFAAALLAERGAVQSAGQALRLLRQQRPGINWNTRQRQFMEEYFQEAVAKRENLNDQDRPQFGLD